jgi:hypothetical protein
MKRLFSPNVLWVGIALLGLLIFPLIQRSQYYQHVMVMTMMAAVLAH